MRCTMDLKHSARVRLIKRLHGLTGSRGTQDSLASAADDDSVDYSIAYLATCLTRTV